ncbi:MAG: STAS-like domain-containing protein [Clostridia bacterium]|nr:STAS-like domain-containing protein [Clostridia bacterium]
MKKHERLLAEKFLLQRIFEEDPDFVDKTMEAFSLSRSTVYNYINRLQDAGELERVGGSMPYRILYHTSRFTIDTSKERSEDRIYNRDIAPLLEELPPAVQKIWRYAITAMLNNAMEHARASAIVCVVNRSRLSTIVGVLDNGIGIFRRIAQDIREQTGDTLTANEAASLLYSGGYTSAPDTHMGQGIFFTSRLMDHFAIRSDTALFTPHAEDADDEGSGERFRGTAVQMALANDTTRELGTLMARYIDPEEGFIRTEIPVARMFGGTYPVSRSEARRLGEIMEGFAEVELDFAGVEELGPDFAHELFAVIARQRTDLQLTRVNMNESVAAAIRRAERT